jgi:group I intron endonuclease
MTEAGAVYLVTNTVTGEQYVGQTRQSISKRWQGHVRIASCKTAKKYKLHEAIAKYGTNAFSVDPLYVAFDLAQLNVAEIALIAEFQPTYNSSLGGAGLRPRSYSDEAKKKRSDAAKKRWSDPEWRAKTVESIKQAYNTPKGILHGKRLGALGGGRLRWAGYVRPLPELKNRAESVSRSWQDPNIRQARIAGQKATFSTPEAKLKRSEVSKGRTQKPKSIAQSARAKWRPVFCPELQISFLSQTHAADYFGVVRSAVANAVKQKGKVCRQYTLIRVA